MRIVQGCEWNSGFHGAQHLVGDLARLRHPFSAMDHAMSDGVDSKTASFEHLKDAGQCGLMRIQLLGMLLGGGFTEMAGDERLTGTDLLNLPAYHGAVGVRGDTVRVGFYKLEFYRGTAAVENENVHASILFGSLIP